MASPFGTKATKPIVYEDPLFLSNNTRIPVYNYKYVKAKLSEEYKELIKFKIFSALLIEFGLAFDLNKGCIFGLPGTVLSLFKSFADHLFYLSNDLKNQEKDLALHLGFKCESILNELKYIVDQDTRKQVYLFDKQTTAYENNSSNILFDTNATYENLIKHVVTFPFHVANNPVLELFALSRNSLVLNTFFAIYRV